MMQWSNEIFLMPSLVAASIMLGEVNVPVPSTTVTLRPFAIEPRPLVSLLMTDSFQPRSLSMSTLALPKLMPLCSISSASVMTLAACSNALDGMQPTLRQTPPNVG